MSSLARAEVNWGPLSDIKVSWRLNHLKTLWKKSFPTSATSMVFEHASANSDVAVQYWTALDSTIVLIVRVHVDSSVTVL